MLNFSIELESSCCICGSSLFKAGFNGRLAFGRPPQCAGCGSMERHRSLRQVYSTIGRDRFVNSNCIQFSSDPAVAREWFGEFTVSEYGGQNSQDICAITYADSLFDWVVCNHVLEHIPDDVIALRELLRIDRPEGVVQVSFPMPHYLVETNDWGHPKPEDHGHYRYYGADVVNRLIEPSGAAA